MDNLDPTIDEYKNRHGDIVIVFDKRKYWEETDDGDNFGIKGTPLYARNAVWDIAKNLGLTHFLVLDDDYHSFHVRFNSDLEYITGSIKTRIEDCIEACYEFLDESGADCVAMSQGGDHIGGGLSTRNKDGPTLSRKIMNAFFFRVDRPFKFVAAMNDDVSTYVTLGRKGKLFFQIQQIMLTQTATQKNTGGLTELYLDAGTYVKSFYSVMWEPSCVKVTNLNLRVHHCVDWKSAAPLIVSNKFTKHD
jgi:hypothetical protein